MLELPTRHVDKLIVNTSNLERTIAENKCELDGVREIFKLLQSSRFEEMWLFIPGADRTKCKWIEIGRTATSGTDEATVRVDRTFLVKTMTEHDELHLYHFHPLAHFEKCESSAGCDELLLPSATDKISEQGLISNLRFAMPSPEDIYFMMEVSWEFDQIHRGVGKISNKVITPYGIVEYALTDSGKERFDRERNLRQSGLYIKLVAAKTLYDDNIDTIISENSDNIKEALKQLAQNMNSKYLRVTLTPF